MRTTIDARSLRQGPPPAVLRHSMRQRWGRAVMVWEAHGKRAFQFEDGALRIFKDGFYHLLEEVELADEEARRLAARLVRQHEREDTPEPQPLTAEPAVTEKEQQANAIDARVGWFLARYPGGFQGEKWQREQRGDPEQARKRHRDPVLALAAERLQPGLPPVELAQALAELAASTDLVGPSAASALADLDPAAQQSVGEGLAALLDDSATFAIRFERWLDRLALGAPTLARWSVATLPLALLHPQDHAFVRRTPMRREAMLRGLEVPTAPSAPTYELLRGMVRDIGARLAEADARPADLLDVADFVRVTMSPSAQRELMR